MQFTKETVKFLSEDIMVWVEMNENEEGEVL
jgi:hypothetical protein